MPRYQFSVTPDGLTVDVFVGVGRPLATRLLAAGVPVPKPVVVTALIDTGADVTAVSAGVIRQLGLSQPVGTSSKQTASALVSVRRFELAVGLPSAVTGGSPVFWGDPVLVQELTVALGFEVLIGLDLLLASRLTLDGPAGTFALEV